LKITAVIPAYHEKGNIGELSIRLKTAFVTLGLDYNIFFVIQGNDGSVEELQELKRYEIPQLCWAFFPDPLGVGLAFRHGFQHLAPDCTHVLTLDADLNHQPEELPAFVEAIQCSGTDIVVGSRYIPGGMVLGMPLWKFALSRLVNVLFYYTTGLRVADKTSGYRLMRREVVDLLKTATVSNGFAFYVEFLWKAHLAGYTIHEIPIVFKWRVAGQSKMHKFPTLLSYLALLWRTLWKVG